MSPEPFLDTQGNTKQETTDRKNKHETENVGGRCKKSNTWWRCWVVQVLVFFSQNDVMFSEQAQANVMCLFGTFKKKSKTLHSSINLRILWPTSISGGYHLTQVPFLLVIALLRPSVVLLHIPVLAHMPWSKFALLNQTHTHNIYMTIYIYIYIIISY